VTNNEEIRLQTPSVGDKLNTEGKEQEEDESEQQDIRVKHQIMKSESVISKTTTKRQHPKSFIVK